MTKKNVEELDLTKPLYFQPNKRGSKYSCELLKKNLRNCGPLLVLVNFPYQDEAVVSDEYGFVGGEKRIFNEKPCSLINLFRNKIDEFYEVFSYEFDSIESAKKNKKMLSGGDSDYVGTIDLLNKKFFQL